MNIIETSIHNNHIELLCSASHGILVKQISFTTNSNGTVICDDEQFKSSTDLLVAILVEHEVV